MLIAAHPLPSPGSRGGSERRAQAQQARARAPDLRRTLQDSGLVLGALDIMQGSPLPADEVFLAEVVGP